MRELTLQHTPPRLAKGQLATWGRQLGKTFRRVVKAVDDCITETDQFSQRLERAKHENFQKFWPYYIRR